MQVVMQARKCAVPPPAVVVVAHNLVVRQVMWQQSPGTATPCQVDERVDDLPCRVVTWPARSAWHLLNQWTYPLPLLIRQIRGVGLSFHNLSLPHPTLVNHY